MKHTYFKSMQRIFAPQFMTTTRLIWKLRQFAIRLALQTKCVGVWSKCQNLGLSPFALYRKRFFYHNWWPSWILTSLVIRKVILNNFIVSSYFSSTKHVSRGNFCVSLIIRSWDKEISIFGLFFRFSRGETFRHRFDYISKLFHIST